MSDDNAKSVAASVSRGSAYRRILTRASQVVVGTLWLLVAYILSYGLLFWWEGTQRRTPSAATADKIERVLSATVYRPLVLYAENKCPGWELIFNFAVWCSYQGQSEPMLWSEMDAFREAHVK